MVYATGSERPFVLKKQLKTKRAQSKTSKEISSYIKTHKFSVQSTPSGEVFVKSTKI